jgi:lipoyl(octanoyl) transferase
MTDLNIIQLGKMDYAKALKIQEMLLKKRQEDKIGDTLLLVEHPPVLTVGRRGSDDNIKVSRKWLADHGVSVYPVNRGGDVTYHGPGQIVGYPIMDLTGHGRDIKTFVSKLKDVFIRLLREEYHIEATGGDQKYTGVFVGDEKITAIGIAVKRWVTMHGFAFNVNTDLAHFDWIVPCGLADKGVTSVEKLLGMPQDFEAMNEMVARYFCEEFGMGPQWTALAALLPEGGVK